MALGDESAVFIQQNPDVIDQGVFHNDVIAVGNQNVLFFHQQAFLNTEAALAEVRTKFGDGNCTSSRCRPAEVSVQDAVKSYLFNTQILTLPSGEMAIIAPTECRDNPAVSAYLARLVTLGTPIKDVHYMDVKQSMRNGGGPACLRLRVAMNDTELAAVNPASPHHRQPVCPPGSVGREALSRQPGAGRSARPLPGAGDPHRPGRADPDPETGFRLPLPTLRCAIGLQSRRKESRAMPGSL
jgi:hypothetical protein